MSVSCTASAAGLADTAFLKSTGSIEPSPSPSPGNINLSNVSINMAGVPKIGTLVPNRVFVGGISSNTTEKELHQLFSEFGNVKQTKIIADRSGVSKGYGFVTFETEEEARRLQAASEDIILKERKLNIAPAIKKQQTYNRSYEMGQPVVNGAIYYHNGIPYTYQQNGVAMFITDNVAAGMVSPTNGKGGSAAPFSLVYPSPGGAMFLPSPTPPTGLGISQQQLQFQAAIREAAAAQTQNSGSGNSTPSSGTQSGAWRWMTAPQQQQQQATAASNITANGQSNTGSGTGSGLGTAGSGHTTNTHIGVNQAAALSYAQESEADVSDNSGLSEDFDYFDQSFQLSPQVFNLIQLNNTATTKDKMNPEQSYTVVQASGALEKTPLLSSLPVIGGHVPSDKSSPIADLQTPVVISPNLRSLSNPANGGLNGAADGSIGKAAVDDAQSMPALCGIPEAGREQPVSQVCSKEQLLNFPNVTTSTMEPPAPVPELITSGAYTPAGILYNPSQAQVYQPVMFPPTPNYMTDYRHSTPSTISIPMQERFYAPYPSNVQTDPSFYLNPNQIGARPTRFPFPPPLTAVQRNHVTPMTPITPSIDPAAGLKIGYTVPMTPNMMTAAQFHQYAQSPPCFPGHLMYCQVNDVTTTGLYPAPMNSMGAAAEPMMCPQMPPQAPFGTNGPPTKVFVPEDGTNVGCVVSPGIGSDGGAGVPSANMDSIKASDDRQSWIYKKYFNPCNFVSPFKRFVQYNGQPVTPKFPLPSQSRMTSNGGKNLPSHQPVHRQQVSNSQVFPRQPVASAAGEFKEDKSSALYNRRRYKQRGGGKNLAVEENKTVWYQEGTRFGQRNQVFHSSAAPFANNSKPIDASSKSSSARKAGGEPPVVPEPLASEEDKLGVTEGNLVVGNAEPDLIMGSMKKLTVNN